MRAILIAIVSSLVALVPTNGNAQAYSSPTPAPQVTAAGAAWQIQGEPLFYDGNFYYPAGPNVFFDGNVMVRTGVYKGVPLFIDASVDPYGVVYVPVGGNAMRPYERLRSGELAGTVGSRAPSFPIERDVDRSAASGSAGLTTPPTRVTLEPEPMPERAVGTAGMIAPRPVLREDAAAPLQPAHPRPTTVESIPRPRGSSGVWLEFQGARYYSAGDAVPYSPARFVPIGVHHGFPVYRDARGNPNEIFVTVVKGGPVAPFKR